MIRSLPGNLGYVIDNFYELDEEEAAALVRNARREIDYHGRILAAMVMHRNNLLIVVK